MFRISTLNLQFRLYYIVISIFIILFCSINMLFAQDIRETVTSTVRIIHAKSDNPSEAPHIDEELKDLANQLQSVFKYTSYHLIESHTLKLITNAKGIIVPLPGERSLEIAQNGINGQRIKFMIYILNKNSQIFNTQILLKSGSSVTIGGPDFNNGCLLFNISGLIN